MLKKLLRHSPVKNKLALIILGSVVWASTTVKSGLLYDFGLGFWGPHGHDGIWHISLIRSLAQGSWQMPIFAGQQIKNYHLGFDLLLALIHRLTSIPVTLLYFQLIPPVLAVLIGLLSYRFIFNWTKSAASAWWAVFFVYFGGSLGWVLGRGESAFWSQAAISTLINPPFALSLVLLLAFLLLLHHGRYFWAAVVLAALPHVKIYAGLLAFAGLAVSGIKNRNLYKTLFLALLIYLPTQYLLLPRPDSLIVFNPGWFLETMMGLSDRLNWPRYYSAMTTYRASGNWFKGIPAYILAFGVFWVGNMGTRLVKEILVLGWIRNFRSATWLDWFMASVIVAGGLIPMLFLQSGTPWNTIQFFYYSLFLSSLLAGIATGRLLTSAPIGKPAVIAASLAIIALTLPTTIDTLAHYLPARPPAKISLEELDALSFLSRQPAGVVLTPPSRPDPYAPPPRPLYLYESTAYVSAYSGQPVFLEDEVNLNITGYDWPARRREVESFFSTTDSTSARTFLTQNRITYLYLPSVAAIRPVLSETALGMTKLFENSRSAIWKVVK